MDVLSEIESRIGLGRKTVHENGRLQKQHDKLNPGDRYFVNGAEQRVLAVFGGRESNVKASHPYWVFFQNELFEDEDDARSISDTERRVTGAVKFYPWREKPEFVGLRNPLVLVELDAMFVEFSKELPIGIPINEQMERFLNKLNEREKAELERIR